MASDIKYGPIAGFARGFSYPFSSFRFINSNPGLAKFIVIPFLINVIVFSLVVYFGFGFFQDIVLARIPQADAWYWFLLNYLMLAIGILVTMVFVFFTFTATGCLISSPFNDILSERTEELMREGEKERLFSWAAFVGDAKRTMITEVKKISVFCIGMLLIFSLNLIPGLGSLLYSFLSVLWVIFFLIVEYTGYTLARKSFLFVDQRRLVWKRFSMMVGFGSAVFCMLAIPFVQFISIPAGVVGATRMLIENDLISLEPVVDAKKVV